MNRFKNILYYIDGMDEPSSALQRAVNLAESNQARLTLIDVVEPVDTPAQIKSRYKLELTDLLSEQREQALQALCDHYQQPGHLIYSKVLHGQPFVEIIKLVQRGGYDLLMKVANAPVEFGEKLFGGQDLHLLRKCPCPVLIDKPGSSANYSRVLATIDTGPSQGNGCNAMVMALAHSLAQQDQAQLDVVHAWRLKGESSFRSGRFRVPEIELQAMLTHELETRKQHLAKVIEDYPLTLQDERVHLEKGSATQSILKVASAIDADIIVMGTLGRAGIPGFFIGNTAEEVLQSARCSVLAVKPPGFESPVK